MGISVPSNRTTPQRLAYSLTEGADGTYSLYENTDSEFIHDNPEYTAALQSMRPQRDLRYSDDDEEDEDEEEVDSDNYSAVSGHIMPFAVRCTALLRVGEVV